MQDSLGIGVIGIGVRGCHGYEHTLAKVADPAPVRVVAMAQDPHVTPEMLEDRGPTYWRQQADGLGAALVDDYRRVLDRNDVDIVSVMVEPNRKADVVEEVAAAGKHMVLDKPLCVTVDQAHRIEQAVRAAGVKALVTHNERYVPALWAIAQQVFAGQIGQLLSANYVGLFMNGPLTGFTATRAYARAYGGGDVRNHATYAVDYLLWVARSTVRRVYAQMGTFFYDDYVAAGVEDLGQIALSFANGVEGTIVTGRVTAKGQLGPEVDLTGAEGSLTSQEGRAGLRVWDSKQEPRTETSAEPPVLVMAREFIRAIVEDRPSPIGVDVAARGIEALEAARRSAEAGQPVEMEAAS